MNWFFSTKTKTRILSFAIFKSLNVLVQRPLLIFLWAKSKIVKGRMVHVVLTCSKGTYEKPLNVETFSLGIIIKKRSRPQSNRLFNYVYWENCSEKTSRLTINIVNLKLYNFHVKPTTSPIGKHIICYVVVIKYSKHEKATGSLTCRFVVYFFKAS